MITTETILSDSIYYTPGIAGCVDSNGYPLFVIDDGDYIYAVRYDGSVWDVDFVADKSLGIPTSIWGKAIGVYNNFVHIAIIYRTGGFPNYTYYVLYFTNESGAWTEEQIHSGTNRLAYLCGLAVSDAGVIHITWTENTTAPNTVNEKHSWGNTGAWNTETVFSYLGTNTSGNTRIVYDSYPQLLTLDSTDLVLYSKNPAWSSEVVVAGVAADIYNLSITIHDGITYVVYYDSSDSSIHYVNNSGGSWSVPVSLIPSMPFFQEFLESGVFCDGELVVIAADYSVDTTSQFIRKYTLDLTTGVWTNEIPDTSPHEVYEFGFTSSSVGFWILYSPSNMDEDSLVVTYDLCPVVPGLTQPINDIIFLSLKYCESCNGNSINTGMIGLSAEDSFVAEIGTTQDGGISWVLVNGPFDADQNIISVTVFELDKYTKRWLIARKDDGADVIEVAYSDDYGTTWAIVEVSSDVGGGIDSGALFAVNKNNIWLGVNDGSIFFSANGGEDWTEQTTPITEDIHAVHFADTFYGFAVASNGQVIKTKDGGSTWIKVTDISGTPNVNCVHCFNEFRAIVGTENGYIYMTFNGGDTWVAKKSVDGKVTDISFSDDFVGYASATLSYTPTKGRILRTINGGQDWESLYTPLCENLNALDIVSTNTAWFVGDEAGAAFIIKASG